MQNENRTHANMRKKKKEFNQYLDHEGKVRVIRNNWVRKVLNIDFALYHDAEEYLMRRGIQFQKSHLITALMGTARHEEILCRCIFKKVKSTEEYRSNYSVNTFDTTYARSADMTCNPIPRSSRVNLILRCIPIMNDEELKIIVDELTKVQQNELD